MTHIKTRARLSVTLAMAALVAGCASVSTVKPGTPVTEVIKQFGNPAVSCPAPNGGTRMVWSQEPAGEQAYGTVVGSNGLVGKIEPMLSKPEFTMLDQGSWDAGKLRCEFGPPAKITQFADNPNQVTWEYRYYGGSTGAYMMWFVNLDSATNQVTGYSTGPDPQLNPSVMGR
jgi:hypothetical protein